MSRKKEKLILLAVLLLVFISCVSFAEAEQNYLGYLEPEQVSQPNLFWELVKLLLALAFVLSITYLFLQFLGKRRTLFLAQGQFINIIENSYLAPNKSIALVEAGNKFLLLGLTEHQITLLTEITDPQIISLLRESRAKDERQGESVSFAKNLADFLNKKDE